MHEHKPVEQTLSKQAAVFNISVEQALKFSKGALVLKEKPLFRRLHIPSALPVRLLPNATSFGGMLIHSECPQIVF
jgi:hypothetical protein